MDHAGYLRDRAAEFANMAVTTPDAKLAQNFHQLAMMCSDIAEQFRRRVKTCDPADRPSGQSPQAPAMPPDEQRSRDLQPPSLLAAPKGLTALSRSSIEERASPAS